MLAASCTLGTGSVPGLKRPGRGASHPPPSTADANERVELHLYSPLGLNGLYRVPFTFFTSKLVRYPDLSIQDFGGET
jgi:hypothetical protein